jgi:signal peptidase
LGYLILIAFCLCAAAILVLQGLGYKPMVILSGSMEPAYHVGGLVFINSNASLQDIKVGDVVAYNVDEDTVVTHRVVSIDPAAQEFKTKGDANDSEDLASVPFANMVGKAWITIPELGYAIMNLKTTKGFGAACILVALLVVLFIIPVLLKPAKPAAPKPGTPVQEAIGEPGSHEIKEEVS